MHPLLKRQLAKLGLDEVAPPSAPADWQLFLDRVAQAYLEMEQGRALIERSLALSSQEMQDLYEQLRQTSEGQLAENHAKLEAVIRSFGDGLCVSDHEWRVQRLNPVAEQLLGIAQQEAIGLPLEKVMMLSSAEAANYLNSAGPILTQLRQGVAYRHEDSLLTRLGGASCPVSVVVNPMQRDGQVSGAVVVFRDISERKRAAQIVQQTADQLRAQQAAMLGLTKSEALQSGILTDAFKEITHTAAETLAVARVSVWLLNVDRRAMRCAHLYELGKGGQSPEIELKAETFPRYFGELVKERVVDAHDARRDPRTSEFANNYLVPLGITSMLDVPVRFKGRLVGVVCIEHIGPIRQWSLVEQEFASSMANLVSLALEAADRLQAEQALRKSERQTRLVIDTALDAVIGMDEKGCIIDWNAQAKNIFGWAREEVLGKQMADTIIPPTHRVSHERGMASFLRTGEGSVLNKRIEITAMRRDGREIPVELAVTPVHFDNACIYTAFLVDITERKRAEKALIAAKTAAEAASKSKSEFLANMSHEIRTPMNGVLGMTQLLLRSDLTDNQRRLAETVHRSGTSLLGIINDVLDFSKIEAGKLELVQDDFDLQNTMQETLELFSEAVRKSGVTLRCVVSEALPAWLKGDRDRLKQVAVNLIGNAVKFTQRGCIDVRVDCLERVGPTVTVKVSVSDTGVGMAPETQSMIFQAFVQADSSITRQYGGTGLGLAISQRLVALMGGDIGVESKLGQGSTFWFTAQFAVSAHGPESEESVMNASKQPSPSPSGERSVLLVEDNPVNREVASEMLEILGCRVHQASNGREGIVAAQQSRYDLILMDCQMPDVDGFTATAAIRQEETQRNVSRRIPIVALTAHAMTGYREQCLTAGMDDYLSKPFAFDQLKAVLTRWLPNMSTPGKTLSRDNGASSPSEAARPIPCVVAGTVLDETALAEIRQLQRPGRPDMLKKVLTEYLDSSRRTVHSIQEAVQKQDADVLRAAAHRLKSSSGQVGALAVAADCERLEQMGANRRLEGADEAFREFEQDYAAACQAMEDELAKGRPVA